MHSTSTSEAERFSLDIRTQQSEVVAIELLGSAYKSSHDHDVVVVYRNGVIDCLSADLQTTKWSSNLESLLPFETTKFLRKKSCVEFAALSTGDVIRRTFLKERDDIVAMLDPSLKLKQQQLANSPFLAVVCSSLQDGSSGTASRSLHLLELRMSPPSAFLDGKISLPVVRHLVAWQFPTIPDSIKSSSEKPAYAIHFATGTVQQLKDGFILSYDFMQTSPQLTSVSRPPNGGFTSFTRLSSSQFIAASTSAIGIYNLKYKSLQGVLTIPGGNSTLQMEKKRKRSVPSLYTEDISLITYLSEIGMVVGVTKNELVAIQLDEEFYQKRVQRRTNFLINSIGRGVDCEEIAYKEQSAAQLARPFSQQVVQHDAEMCQWLEQSKRLDQFAERNDIQQFEFLFAKAIGILEPQVDPDQKTMALVGTSNEDLSSLNSTNLMSNWGMSTTMTEAERVSHRPKAIYALSRIFQWSSAAGLPRSSQDVQSSISIRFLPPNVFQWLLVSQFLSKDLVERALKQASPQKDRKLTIRDGDIATSIFNYDSKMRLLYFVLNTKVYLDIREIVQVIKLIVRSLDTTPLSHLTSHPVNGATDGLAEIEDLQVERAVQAAADAIDFAIETLENGVLIRGQTLRPALIKLQSFPPARIVQSLRTMMDHHELIFLIQLLRIELQEGGWASRYFAQPTGEDFADTGNPSDRAISIIAGLLSCVLDAIGIGGWLTTGTAMTSTEKGLDDLVHQLHLESSAALEGIYEASFMKGLLAEFLRFCQRDANTEKPPNYFREQLMEKPFRVPRQDSEYEALQRRVLPLGLKPVDVAQDKWKRDVGGQWKLKSSREIGLAISKQVPKYSIEKIRI